MVDGDRIMVCRLTIAAHTVTPVHSHMHEQVTLVERGRADFFVDGRAPHREGRRRAGVSVQRAARRHHARRRGGTGRHLLAAARRLPGEARRARRPAVTPQAVSAFTLDGQVALVTGASRGLGAAMAVALAAAGADLALHSNEQPAMATADAHRRSRRRAHGALHGRPLRSRRRGRARRQHHCRVRAHRHPGQQRRHHPAPCRGAAHRRGMGRGDRSQPLERVPAVLGPWAST